MALSAIVRKRPKEKYAIGLKFVAPDLDSENEEILSAVVTVVPDEALGIKTLGSPVIDINIVSQTIIDGEDGRDYNVVFKITTSTGNIYEDAILVCVRDIA